MNKTNRLVWADSLKGFLIILVILGHAIQVVCGADCDNSHLWNLIYSFHMPAFVAISGFFAYRGNKNVTGGGGYWNYIKKRSSQLLLPFFIWSLLSFTINGNYSIDNLISVVLYPDRYFWFLWVLFWICVLFVSVRFIALKINIDELVLESFIGALMLGCMVVLDIRVLGFQFLAYYFIFYLVGYCIHRFHFLKITNKWWLLLLFLCWFALGWSWNMHKLPIWFPQGLSIPCTLLQYTYRGLTALIATVLLLNAGPLLLNNTSKFNEAVCKMGEYSLGIYVGHLCFIGFIHKGMRNLLPYMSTSFQILILFIVSLLSTLLIVWALNRTSITSMIFLGKKQLR